MSISTVCPQCHSQFLLQDELAGRHVQCQNCQTVFIAPEPNTPTPSQSSVLQQAAPPKPHQDSISSVFDQNMAPPEPSPHPSMAPGAPYQGHVQKTGSNRGLVIGGIVGVVVILLCILGIGASYAWSILTRDSFDPTEVASTTEVETPETNESIDNIIRQYGEDRVARLRVNVSHQINQSPQGFLLQKAREPLAGRVTTYIRHIGGNNYEALVAPVDNLQFYYSQLQWLTNKSMDQSRRTISGNATMPPESSVASSDIAANAEQTRLENERRRQEQAEERERERQERLAEQQARAEEREKESAIRMADARKATSSR